MDYALAYALAHGTTLAYAEKVHNFARTRGLRWNMSIRNWE